MPERKPWSGKLPATPNIDQTLRQYAREMRQNPTPAERTLWKHLKNNQRHGYKFRRQHVIEHYIVDFYCAAAHLVLELDGAVHEYTGEQDAARDDVLQALGITVLRFENKDVFVNLAWVLETIDEYLGS